MQKWSAEQNHERHLLLIAQACSCMIIHENNYINNYIKQLFCRIHKDTPRYVSLSVFIFLNFFIIRWRVTRAFCLLNYFVALLLKIASLLFCIYAFFFSGKKAEIILAKQPIVFLLLLQKWWVTAMTQRS